MSTVVFTPTSTGSLNLQLAWSSTDPAPSSGIAGYDVDYKIGAGNWTPWLTDTDQIGDTFRGSPDTSYAFRVRVKDQAGNPSPWVQSSSLSVSPITKYYTFGGQKVAMRRGSQVYYLPWRPRVSKLTWINLPNNRRHGRASATIPTARSAGRWAGHRLTLVSPPSGTKPASA